MRRKKVIGMSGLAVFALCAATVRAQEQDVHFEVAVAPPIEIAQAGAPPEASAMFTEERVELLGFGGMHGGKVVKGSPFSAVAVSEMTQTLADGNRIVHKSQTSLFRDSQGRFRRETSLPALGPLAALPTHGIIEIHDPVAGTAYILEPEGKIARKIGHGPEGGMLQKMPPPDGVASMGRNVIMYHKMGGADNANVKKEDLGAQVVNGVSAQGTRATRTIAAGEIGNEKPLTIVNEIWYSNDLQMVVQSKRSDPRFGETTYTLTNLQRAEPDESLFAVPSDYTIQEGGPMMQFHKRVALPPPPGAPAPNPEN